MENIKTGELVGLLKPSAIEEIGEKYNLSTARFMRVISEKSPGEKITIESITRDMIGEDCDTVSDGDKNLIKTLVKPDFEQAVELNALKKISEDDDEYEVI